MKETVFVYNMNIQNLQQNSEVMYINKEMNLLQDLLKKNEKIQNQFQNGFSKERTNNNFFSNQNKYKI